mmetsp:Transcript_14498/g.41675  ORF Transcript_14498/g.41675 Transcript_14498/m.41675 type:complete len:229 (-) Transcript_14498:738-1424(-)
MSTEVPAELPLSQSEMAIRRGPTCRRTSGAGSVSTCSSARSTPHAPGMPSSCGTTASTSWAAPTRTRGRTTSTATTSASACGCAWSPSPAMRLPRGQVPRPLSAAIASSTSVATPRRTGTTSTTCSSSTSPMRTGPCSTAPCVPAFAPTTPASFTRRACSSSAASTGDRAFRTCTSTRSRSGSGPRLRSPTMDPWAASATPRSFTAQACSCSAAGTATIRWTTCTNFP